MQTLSCWTTFQTDVGIEMRSMVGGPKNMASRVMTSASGGVC